MSLQVNPSPEPFPSASGSPQRKSSSSRLPQGESRIAEDLVFAPFWTWTLTYIPRSAGNFDSNAVIDRKPYLDYTVVGADEGRVPPIQPRRSHKRHRRRFLRLPGPAAGAPTPSAVSSNFFPTEKTPPERKGTAWDIPSPCPCAYARPMAVSVPGTPLALVLFGRTFRLF